jgi:hypothetical protein
VWESRTLPAYIQKYPQLAEGIFVSTGVFGTTDGTKADEMVELSWPSVVFVKHLRYEDDISAFEPLMGMDFDTIYTMFPMDERHDGTVNDAAVTNPDTANNYDE